MKLRPLLFWLLFSTVNLISLYFVLILLFIFDNSFNDIFIPGGINPIFYDNHFNFVISVMVRVLVLFIESLLMLGVVFLINLLLLTAFELDYETSKITKLTFIIEMVFVFAIIILVMSGIYSKGN